MFEGEHHSIASVPGFKDRTIILDGFSKTYANDWLAAWLRSNATGSGPLKFSLLMTNSNSCTASFTQVAGRGKRSKVTRPSVETMRLEFPAPPRYVRARVETRSKAFLAACPKGAFYAFPNIQKTGWTSKKAGRTRLLEQGWRCRAFRDGLFGSYGEGLFALEHRQLLRETWSKPSKRIGSWVGKTL